MFEQIKKSLAALAVTLLIGAATTTWAASGTWKDASTTADWSNANTASWQGAIVADGAANTADFSTINLPGDTTINVVDARTIGNLVFGDTEIATTPASWLLSGNTITLAGTTPTITVNALGDGKNVIMGDVIAGTAGLTKAGPGTLALTANNTLTGGVNINGGTFDSSFSGTVLAN